MTNRIESLARVAGHHDVILCDVWGVLHNGVEPFAQAGDALAEARKTGVSVVLITNSPRPADGVLHQLEMIGVRSDAFDRIVTSGDVTRKLIAEGPEDIFFLGPERDLSLLDGLKARPVGPGSARAIVCTGFFDEETETPESYREMLAGFVARKLPFICANPDLVVERGDRLIPCAGAVAALYEELGGQTRIAGKPYQPIYDAALAEAESLRGPVGRSRVLAIGDGMPTDVKGALGQGLDLLYISAGIHARDYMTGSVTDEARLQAFLDGHQARPRWWMPRLA